MRQEIESWTIEILELASMIFRNRDDGVLFSLTDRSVSAVNGKLFDVKSKGNDYLPRLSHNEVMALLQSSDIVSPIRGSAPMLVHGFPPAPPIQSIPSNVITKLASDPAAI